MLKNLLALPNLSLGLFFLCSVAIMFISVPFIKTTSKKKYGILLTLAIVPLLSLLLYSQWGSSETLIHQNALNAIEKKLEIIVRSDMNQGEIRESLLRLQKEIMLSDLALMRLGEIYIELGFFDEAIALYQNQNKCFFKNQPAQALAQWLHANSMKFQGKLPVDVRAQAEKEAALYPKQSLLLNLFAIDDYLQGRYVSAMQYWQEIIKMDPMLPEDKKQVFEKAIAQCVSLM